MKFAHLSGSPERLDREVARRYHENRACRAEEELIAELAAAMMGAHLGFAGDHIDDHARYIGSWIKALRSDKRLILKAAAEAQRAVDWMFEAAGVDSDAVEDGRSRLNRSGISPAPENLERAPSSLPSSPAIENSCPTARNNVITAVATLECPP